MNGQSPREEDTEWLKHPSKWNSEQEATFNNRVALSQAKVMALVDSWLPPATAKDIADSEARKLKDEKELSQYLSPKRNGAVIDDFNIQADQYSPGTIGKHGYKESTAEYLRKLFGVPKEGARGVTRRPDANPRSAYHSSRDNTKRARPTQRRSGGESESEEDQGRSSLGKAKRLKLNASSGGHILDTFKQGPPPKFVTGENTIRPEGITMGLNEETAIPSLSARTFTAQIPADPTTPSITLAPPTSPRVTPTAEAAPSPALFLDAVLAQRKKKQRKKKERKRLKRNEMQEESGG
ncbi:MAG: hypothetical protein M1829_005865 [Trizodia sp. TS-e1964]|nr:MAG: hypothetical protein M1829_005865 [Trizodia sp. TS-e1964]